MHSTLSLSFMFEKWTKKVSNKVADSAIEGAAQSLNDRINKYGDIIQIGLVLGVIALGTRHIARQSRMSQNCYIPAGLPAGQPIIVNNYYREREDRKAYEQSSRKNCYIHNGQVCQQKTGKAYSKR